VYIGGRCMQHPQELTHRFCACQTCRQASLRQFRSARQEKQGHHRPSGVRVSAAATKQGHHRPSGVTVSAAATKQGHHAPKWGESQLQQHRTERAESACSDSTAARTSSRNAYGTRRPAACGMRNGSRASGCERTVDYAIILMLVVLFIQRSLLSRLKSFAAFHRQWPPKYIPPPQPCTCMSARPGQ
jgi:hypothetical protein